MKSVQNSEAKFKGTLFLQKSSLINVQVVFKYASEVKGKDTRMSLTLFWHLIVDSEHISHIGLHAYFTYFTHISHIDASFVDSKP